MIKKLKVQVQVVLDGLLKEALIPFKLTAWSMCYLGHSRYSVHFFDSRIREVEFIWNNDGKSFADVFRASVLGRVARMGGRYKEFGRLRTTIAVDRRIALAGALRLGPNKIEGALAVAS